MIRLQQISRNFLVGEQTVHALDHVDMVIEDGEYLSIMGPSGSGKSTLLNMIGLLDTPSSGTYELNGQDVSTLSDRKMAETRQQQIGFVFQTFHLIPRLTALENVELPMLLAGLPARARRAAARQVLAKTGLEDRMSHRPDQLSGGQRQRVAIARAVVMEPRVVLADEPTGNLDSESGTEIIELLEALNGEGLTLLVVTHDQDVGRRARRRVRMIDGRIDRDEQTAAGVSDASV